MQIIEKWYFEVKCEISLTKVGMLFMKNSLKTSFESDDAEKLDGRKKA